MKVSQQRGNPAKRDNRNDDPNEADHPGDPNTQSEPLDPPLTRRGHDVDHKQHQNDHRTDEQKSERAKRLDF